MNTTWYILASTVPLAIIIIIITIGIMNIKIKKIRAKLVHKNPQENVVAKRKNHGQLLWNLKNKSNKPLGDLEMEFVINSILRNHYKTSFVFNAHSNYEETSLKQIANQKITKNKYDFALLFSSINLKNDFNTLYQNLNKKGMIVVVNAKKRSKNTQKLLKYLKSTNLKNQHEKIGKGVVLVVK